MMNKEEKFYYQKELMNSFFSGNYYITFEDDEDVKHFLEYISIFDIRFSINPINPHEYKNYKEVYWKFSKNLHHHQLEFNKEVGCFYKYDCDIKELKFSQVKEYVLDVIKTYNSPIVDCFRSFIELMGEKE